MNSAPQEFLGKVVFVTGAGTGNGEAIAERFAAAGAQVALVGRSLAPLLALQNRIDADKCQTLPIQADVRHLDSVRAAVQQTLQHFGKMDIAINNAGITGTAGVPLQDVDVAVWQDVIETDVSGMFYCMKTQIPPMLDNGGGVIINLSSANGLVGLAGMSAYTTAKHAVIGLTRSAALELAEQNIRVCAIAPGYVATPRILAAGQEIVEDMAAAHPMKRLAKPQEVADFVAFLASDRAAFITGSVHSVDGGYTAQ